jgi:hypothetical protein
MLRLESLKDLDFIVYDYLEDEFEECDGELLDPGITAEELLGLNIVDDCPPPEFLCTNQEPEQQENLTASTERLITQWQKSEKSMHKRIKIENLA